MRVDLFNMPPGAGDGTPGMAALPGAEAAFAASLDTTLECPLREHENAIKSFKLPLILSPFLTSFCSGVGIAAPQAALPFTAWLGTCQLTQHQQFMRCIVRPTSQT